MTDEWTRAEKRKAQSEQAKAIMDFVSMLSDKIAELEKENAELRNNGFTVSAMTEQQLKVALEKGEQLEKKNAELKRRLDNLFNSDCWASEKLTKAKEIIRELVRVEYADFTNGDYSNELSKALERAEQFLKEIEK